MTRLMATAQTLPHLHPQPSSSSSSIFTRDILPRLSDLTSDEDVDVSFCSQLAPFLQPLRIPSSKVKRMGACLCLHQTLVQLAS
ncbi:hypothetical protein CSUI_003965 [Cystoisospora suis]|uniref:Uncharacterized protein n=1 Tax=Cystoisospora suis TaxID=483139 RepID=A0A2C6L2A4_9APIC|nr:hypothetical protein CSUI_003965 [Cystoisospora suis]